MGRRGRLSIIKKRRGRPSVIKSHHIVCYTCGPEFYIVTSYKSWAFLFWFRHMWKFHKVFIKEMYVK